MNRNTIIKKNLIKNIIIHLFIGNIIFILIYLFNKINFFKSILMMSENNYLPVLKLFIYTISYTLPISLLLGSIYSFLYSFSNFYIYKSKKNTKNYNINEFISLGIKISILICILNYFILNFINPYTNLKYKKEYYLLKNKNIEKFVKIYKTPKEMSFFELYKFMNKMKKDNNINLYKNNSYIKELYNKITIPIACFVLSIFGLLFGIIIKNNNLLTTYIITISIITFYYIFTLISEILIKYSIYFIWLPNILFLIFIIPLIWFIKNKYYFYKRKKILFNFKNIQ